HCGIWGSNEASVHLHFNNLYIHDLFAPVPGASDGKKETMYEGVALQFASPNVGTAHYRDIRIENCRVENIGTHAVVIHKWPRENELAQATFHDSITIVDNHFEKLGGDGIVTAGCKNVYIARNTIKEPGCFDDPRMKGRGDGLWTWYTIDAIAEYNYLSGARGRLDCTGMHVDIGSRNNIFQYNLSYDNEGGFCEIIGDSHNNVYRYNVSINDGRRTSGVNEFGRQKGPGVVILLSGYMADRLGENVKKGPFYSYFYNNTIYTDPSIAANFSVNHSAKGALIANNLFIIEGSAHDISWRRPTDIGDHENIIFTNNRTITGYATIPHDTLQMPHAWDVFLDNIAIDPQCVNPGGADALDYLPANYSVIKDQGIALFRLPNDPYGVLGGFVPVKGDYRGRTINGLPDIGAFEMQ
ncbi:MAG: right-handed parallel beta-helix repeat-containing protein, partial [Saprospiraceae bacterium]|nr:right-handed parallel beta-helix repeat-containing protein [Saprospiraceae bacterium]